MHYKEVEKIAIGNDMKQRNSFQFKEIVIGGNCVVLFVCKLFAPNGLWESSFLPQPVR